MKRIGILGSGMVAKTLGQGFLKHHYQVMLGSGDSNKLLEWQSRSGEGARIGSFAETASYADIIVLAIKGSAALKILEKVGAINLDGKIIIDTTNPISDAPPINWVLQFFTDQNGSLLETFQEAFPKARFVKSFNSIGAARMVNPLYQSEPTMFICGNHAEAKIEVSKILKTFGWEALDMGMAESARAIEPLCKLWCIPGFLQNSWTHAFKVLTHNKLRDIFAQEDMMQEDY